MSRSPRLPLLMRSLAGLAAVAAAGALVGCSSDSDSTPAATETEVVVDENGDGINADQDTLVTAAVAATNADSGEWRDGTMVLTYTDGSVDDVTASINCSAMSHLLSDDDGLVLVYPDGEVDCRDQP